MNHRKPMTSEFRVALSVLTALVLVVGMNLTSSANAFEGPSGIEGNRFLVSAKDILGSSKYQAFSYGGYRKNTRDSVPTVDQLKEDMRILSAMGIKVLRTYNTQQYAQAANLLEAIQQLRVADENFEMYVMLGVWIDCKGAWGDSPDHEVESFENNKLETAAAVALAKKYPDVVKFIAVGNESMVHWASSYFVRPAVILKWVNHLQALKASGELSKDIWVTSSDNFASWGGGGAEYHNDDLKELIKAVDFVSMHTYPFHDTHYNSAYWIAPSSEAELSAKAKADRAVKRAVEYAKSQFESTKKFVHSVAPNKPIHIGETGWASTASTLYGGNGSQAADEYKQRRYYDAMREWSQSASLTCFYFEAFDEPWKDANSPGGSENHFGLININGQAKFALWDLVDQDVFEGLTRGGNPITKTVGGDESKLLAAILEVPVQETSLESNGDSVNKARSPGEPVSEKIYAVLDPTKNPTAMNGVTFPSAAVKVNVWEGTCGMDKAKDGTLQVTVGTGPWWGCALEIQADGKGENLSKFATGHLNFEIKGDTKSAFAIGFQTGIYSAGTQTNNFVEFGPGKKYQLTNEWKSYSVPVSDLMKGAKLNDVTSLLFLRGEKAVDSKAIFVRKINYSQD